MAKKYIADSVEATSITGSLFGTSSWATTSSYALNGGVTSIVAGTNVTISSGTGAVTINASGGGGAAFPYTGSAGISGSLNVNGPVTASYFKGDGSALTGVTSTPIAHLEFNNNEKTIWNNGKENITSNTSFGESVLVSNSVLGIDNTSVGYHSMAFNSHGGSNTALGSNALYSNVTGSGNTAVGRGALQTTQGNNNIGIGASSLPVTIGNSNIAIGIQTGFNLFSGSNNIYIGTLAGPNYGNATENNKLYISSGSGTPLIGGDFAAKTVTISGSLQVLGSVTGTIQSSSYALSSSYSRNATSASHALNGGVNRIIAGTNVTITNGGSGSVTINASGGGGSLPTMFEFNETDKTMWNNGNGNIETNTSFGQFALILNTTGFKNTAIGKDALISNMTGDANTAVGAFTLVSNTTGFANTAIGNEALLSNSTGAQNTAIGRWALEDNTTGDSNTAIGHTALTKNTTGIQNTSIGIASLFNNTTGNTNVAIGGSALTSNTTGSMNTAVGISALQNNTTGDSNTGIGRSSLFSNTTGTDNIAIGNMAGGFIANGSTNTITSASVFLGSNTRALNNNGINQIVIGQSAIGGGSNTVTLGNNSITTLRCQTTSITSLSDSRDKKEILPISEGIEFVNKLKPITFKWDTRDGAKTDIKAAGFIAQDLLEVQESSEIGEYLDLVSNNNPDKLEARYSNLLPVMVKAIQDLSKQVQELQNEVLLLKNK